jgi:hypothetical protein
VNRAAVPSGRNAKASGAITPGPVGDVSVTRVSRSAGATPRCVLPGALFATIVIKSPHEFSERATGYRSYCPNCQGMDVRGVRGFVGADSQRGSADVFGRLF